MSHRALRTTFHSLSDDSLKTSRQLDDTYYSILEKLTVVRRAIANLQELSNMTKQLHETFQADTRELTEDIQGQFDGFADFKGQEKELEELENRIKVGTEKADALTKRLDEAKSKVEAREKVEREWEKKTNRMCTCRTSVGRVELADFCSL
jgi:DNA repair exonuclease SbcCD ATPase subunit